MKHLACFTPLLGALLLLASCSRNGEPEGRTDARTELDHLILQEVFYVGHTWHRDVSGGAGVNGAQLYDEDQYLTIYNPTSEVKYLDGLALCSSALDPSQVVKIQPKDEFVGRYYGAGTMACFPGKGQDYPIRPKQTIVVAKYAIDHQAKFLEELKKGEEDEGNVFHPEQYKGVDRFLDLRKADFEWTNREYLYGSEQRKNDPKIPDLIPMVIEKDEDGDSSPAYSFGFIAEQSGLALVKLPWTREEFDKEYQAKKEKSEYLRHLSITSTHHKSTLAVFEIPFSHVVDCMTICPQSTFLQRVTKLDKGYQAVTERPSKTMPKVDYAKFSGKALTRRWDGRSYVDEGNTRTDFEVKEASLSRK